MLPPVVLSVCITSGQTCLHTLYIRDGVARLLGSVINA
mgnify:CR=1 FL=1|jgi:hypothetical protein